MAAKYANNLIYIYLGIITINAFVNIILLGLFEAEVLNNIIDNNITEMGNKKIILQIDHGKENVNLIQQEKVVSDVLENKIASVDGNKDGCKVKNLNPLQEIHKRLLFADKSHFPSYFQKNSLPMVSENVPVYGNKLVNFKPSSLLQSRNLPEMYIEIPKNTSIGKLTELHKAIDGADEAIKLYDSQFIKFNEVLSGIQNGTEKFYPNEAKPLMETYVDLVTKLSHQQKVMANEAINQLRQLDPRFSRELYPVDNSGNTLKALSVSVTPERGSETESKVTSTNKSVEVIKDR
ncbi:hypothetical protein C8A03DRAFT_20061 [Achaetomium macrosporum]|uniref:Uncharacterized protein n=1 Tax=Achaetomium macrosporum TaxID=79813 RepID=A0AAN7H2T3_9PEZI|nr:hypothetical protein C8A03DRAFT_20061 [Achaetomium macrosporum]